MVDLNMPEGLTDEEQRDWLRRIGQQLVEETGQPSGATGHQEGPDGQPMWGIWWTDDDAE